MNDRATVIDNETGEVITQEDATQAQQAEEQIFGKDGPKKTTSLVVNFVDSYERNKNSMPLQDWLDAEFEKHAVWQSAEERQTTAKEIIDSIQSANDAKADLYTHLDKGKSRESWLANKLEQGAAVSSIENIGEYAAGIDRAIDTAMAEMEQTVRTASGTINNNPSLDGFIAEQHHVDTFNIDAAAKGSSLRAKVLNPEAGSTYQANSMDVGIYDAEGKLLKRYQAKYCKDADATSKAFEQGNYRGQRKLVPADQADQIEGAVDVIEAEGIQSKPLTKQQAKALQDKAQIKQEAKEYRWNEINRIDIAKQIGKKAMAAAALTAGFQGVRILARRTWNALTGKENPSASEDLKEFFDSSIKSGTSVGLQVAVSGAVVVAARNGWIKVLRSTPAGQIANIVYVGLENAKILYQAFQGKISPIEAVDAMGNVTSSAIGGIMGAAKGAAVGTAIGTLLGPVGSAIGGFIGGVVGCIAGSTIGQAVYQGVKKIASAAQSAFASTKNFISNSLGSIFSFN